MLKQLTVKEISAAKREFAERTAKIPCGYYCIKECSGEIYVEVRLIIQSSHETTGY